MSYTDNDQQLNPFTIKIFNKKLYRTTNRQPNGC